MNEEKIYAWDWVLSEGDTIKEKMEDLLDKISTMCVRPSVMDSASVTGCHQICAFLSTSIKTFVPKYEQIGNGKIFVGQHLKECGNNGYCSNFNLYDDIHSEKDEITVVVGDKINIIKIFNFPFEY